MEKLRNTLRKGMQQRRLAGGGEESEDTGDESGPPSPDFTEFCLELGAWSPSESSPGGPRSSPVSVEDYFKSLDQSVEQAPAQTSASGAARTLPQLLLAQPKAGDKRPLDEEDDEALPGPSSKVAKTMQDSSPQFVYPGSLEPITSSQASPGQPTPVDPLSLQPPSSSMFSPLMVQPAPIPQPAASTSASSDVAALSSAGPGGLGPQHPFVQLPTLEPGVKARQFSPSAMRSTSWASKQNWHLLRPLREAFRRPQLNQAEAHGLTHYSERLAANAYHFMQDEVEDLSPFDAVGRLGRKFMTIYYLLRASHVLQQNWPTQPWWDELMKRIPHQYVFAWKGGRQASPFNVDLANELSAAIELLKRGVLPAPTGIINLKRKLFCMPQSPVQFREKLWDPWRQDDEDSQKPPETSGSL
ncbi:hypothetical protein Emed_003678 [Eimeria media]